MIKKCYCILIYSIKNSSTSLSWFIKTLQQNKVMNLKVLMTSVPNKPSLYSNILKRRQAHDDPIVHAVA